MAHGGIMLPKVIEEQEQAADELHAKIYGNPGTQGAVAPQEAAAATPAPTESKQEQQPEEPAKPLKAPPEKEADPEYWRRRAELMAGKYEAEVPRYAQELRSIKEERDRLQAEIERLKSQPAPIDQATPAGVPQELVEKYGEEFIEDIKKLAPVVQPKIEIPSDVVSKVEQLERTLEEERFEKFKTRLADHSPQWEQLNTDQGFLTWLAGIDPFSGRPRQELFDDAVAHRDPLRTAQFFNAYGHNQSWEEQNPSGFTPPPLEEQLTPKASKAGEAPPAKKVWSRAEIDLFYQDVRRGNVGDEDAARIEADIFAAQKEGRIR